MIVKNLNRLASSFFFSGLVQCFAMNCVRVCVLGIRGMSARMSEFICFACECERMCCYVGCVCVGEGRGGGGGVGGCVRACAWVSARTRGRECVCLYERVCLHLPALGHMCCCKRLHAHREEVTHENVLLYNLV